MGKKEISGLLCNDTLFSLLVLVGRGLSFLKLNARTHAVHAVENTRMHMTICADTGLLCERGLLCVSGDHRHSGCGIYGIASVGFLHHLSQLAAQE